MIAALALALLAHVPTYGDDSCADNCCVPGSLDLNLSQVLYRVGTGGLEIPLDSAEKETHPDRAKAISSEVPYPIYYDIVIKDPIDNFSLIEVYAGCGGCMKHDNLSASANRTGSIQLQPASLEPFTQTLYWSIFPPDSILDPNFRSFSSFELLPENCPYDHVTVRLIDHNASRSLVWGAVLGKAEIFTIPQLISFPSYVIKNHGPTWNDASYTLFLSAVFAVLIILAWKLQCCGARRWCCEARKRVATYDVCACSNVGWPVWWYAKWYSEDRHVPWREALYAIAQFSFVWFSVEQFWHLLIATAGTNVSIAPGVLLIVFSQLLPLWLTIILWRTVEYRARLAREFESKDCSLSCGACGGCGGLSRLFCRGCVKGATRPDAKPSGIYMSVVWMALTSPSWALLEIITGLLLFTWFGAGLWIGPTCITLAGLLRASDIRRTPDHSKRLTKSLRVALGGEPEDMATKGPAPGSEAPVATPLPSSQSATGEHAPLLAFKL